MLLQKTNEGSEIIDENLPEARALTGPFTLFKDGDAKKAAAKAKSAVDSQAEAAARAAESAARSVAHQAEMAAVKAEAIVAVQQERAAHLSRQAQMAQQRSFISSALATKLSKTVFALRQLETYLIDHMGAARALADQAERLAAQVVKVSGGLSAIESDQQQMANHAQAAAKEIANQQAMALDALANSRVAANHAHAAAEAAMEFQVSKPVIVDSGSQ